MKKLSELGISPAPWKADGMYITSVHGTPIAGVGVPMCESNDFADHRLILAAPDLYDACIAALDYIEEFPDSLANDIREILEAALEKAGGESEVGK